MIYIVSGYMRTGTSMMMQCLSKGGLTPVFNPARNKMNDDYGDDYYSPNIGGFYELAKRQYRHPDFPLMYDGKLIKLLIGGLYSLNVHEYRVVFMKRNPEEIRQSYEAFFGRVAARVEEMAKHYDKHTNRAIKSLENRRDIKSLDIFQYREVVNEPLKHFKKLKESGWEIDPEAAASEVDPKLCRFRVENLERNM